MSDLPVLFAGYFHEGDSRIFIHIHYIGDKYYLAIINRETFDDPFLEAEYVYGLIESEG